jgi:lysine 2,3-aminomutase
MAGAKNGVFKELLSPFLKEKYVEAQSDPARNAHILNVIEKQYQYDEREKIIEDFQKRRHYESELRQTFHGKVLRGVEKLYQRTLLIEPTTVCAAHCRWCLRGQYDIFTLSNEELTTIARYCGEAEENKDVREILITGGDPLMMPEKLEFLFNAVRKHAPQVRIFRIGSRVPLHQPSRIDTRLLDILSPKHAIQTEIALHINHPAELFPEVEDAIAKIREAGITLYDQTVLLKGLNDDLDTLVELFDRLRYLGVESHYLFHCIPMKGMTHHRTSIEEGLKLANQLIASGYDSGRSKPKFTLLTDIGKITLLEGTILKREKNRVLIQSYYRYEDRKKWNPTWKMPDSVVVDENGFMQVWYLDI